jgi:hypothetical protein
MIDHPFILKMHALAAILALRSNCIHKEGLLTGTATKSWGVSSFRI